MTTYYVRSGAAGGGTGADWANAYTTLTLAFTGKAAGDVFYVSEDHSESSASSLTLTSPGTLANRSKIICVNHSGTVPPVSADRRATGQIATTGNSSITIAGAAAIWDGLIFLAGNSTGAPQIVVTNTNSASHKFINCTMKIGSTGAGLIALGNSGTVQANYIEWENTVAQFANTTQTISVANATLRWRNTASALLGTIPATLFSFSSGRAGVIDCSDVDLSAAGSGKIIVGNTVGATAVAARFVNCKLNASVTLSAVSPAHGAILTDFIRCGSAGVSYKLHRDRYAGVLDDETSVVRSGGATDGVTPLAWKIVTTANVNFDLPFEAPPTGLLNNVSGSAITLTVYGTWNSGSLPNNDDIWIDVEYLGSASSPQGSITTSTKADILASGTAVTADGASSWGGGGSGAGWSPFKMSVTFTPQQKGPISVAIKVGKTSSTFYLDPVAVQS